MSDARIAAERRAELEAKRYLTIPEVAFLLDLSERTVHRAVMRAELEAHQMKARGGWRITHRAIERWVNQRTNQPRRRRKAAAPAAARVARRQRRELAELELTDDMGRRS